MNVILLSGGSGKRLWPLSNDVRSKQFIRMLKGTDGYESMVQRVYHQLKKDDPDGSIVIATSKTQVSAIHNHLGDDVDICIEPERRNTYPAIMLATSYMRDHKNLKDEDVVIVCPVDPYVDDDYFLKLKELSRVAEGGKYNITLMGVTPTEPSEKFGYIIPETKENVSKVKYFKEKPSKEVAEEYIKEGGLWNCGVFAFKVGYLLKDETYKELYNNYSELKKTSFDYEVVEKEDNIGILRFAGTWKDIGTWNALTEVMAEPTIGNVTLDDSTENTYIINELNMPLLCMGGKDLVIAASSDGILISDKDKSPHIKEYAEKIATQAMFAEKSWGSFTIIDAGKDSLTIKIKLLPGHELKYHSHDRRDEVWTVLRGEGEVTLDSLHFTVKPGDTVKLPRGTKHTIKALTELEVIEVQIGKNISIEDKRVY